MRFTTCCTRILNAPRNLFRIDAVVRAGSDPLVIGREVEGRTSRKPEVPFIAGSTEGLRSNGRNQPQALLCARNRQPLLNLNGIFSNNIFGLYGLEACPTLQFAAVERSLSDRLLTTISWG